MWGPIHCSLVVAYLVQGRGTLSSPPGQDPSSEIWAPGSLGLPLFAIVLVYAGRVIECPAATKPHRLTLGPFPSGSRGAEGTDWTSRSITEYSAQAAGFCDWTCSRSHLLTSLYFFPLQGQKGSRGEKVSLKGPGCCSLGMGS